MPELPSDRATLNLRWLLRLRWTAAATTALAALALLLLGSALVLPALAGAAAIAGGTLLLRGRRPGGASPWILAVLVADAAVLTWILALGGGAANPLSGLYLFLVVTGSLVLRRRDAWLLLAACGLAYAGLFALPPGPHAHHGAGLQSHLVGMLAVFALLGPFSVLAISNLRADLERSEAAAAGAAALRARNERLASLATMVAGAAHELSTPLGTISVVAHELRRGAEEPLRGDLDLIAEEVHRCIEVLDQMGADAGRVPGEAFGTTHLEAVVEAALARLPEPGRVRTALDPALAGRPLRLPTRQLARALRGLLDNALRAGEGPVELTGRAEGEDLVLEVRDAGAGMPAEVLAHAGEPFFTTREPGRGMGLGLFFARSLAERLGGGLALASTPGEGTVATLRLRAAPEPPDAR